MITHLEPDILECKVKWALGNISNNIASGGDRIPVEPLQSLKDDAQQIWKTQQWPQDWKEINREYSLEGLMLKLKLHYFGHLMRRADSLE